MMMNKNYIDCRLLVMAKSPITGYVKTRMQPFLSESESVELHTALTQYCLQQWSSSTLCGMDVWVGGDVGVFQKNILSLLKNVYKLQLYSQVSGDLGQRMSAAVRSSFDHSDIQGVILLGTDCPFVDTVYIQQALEALASGNDIVIGPANDGGYVLLGMRQQYLSLFNDVQWGTGSVFSITEQRIKQLGVEYCVLPSLPDIDTPEDLMLLDSFPFYNQLSFIK